MTDLVIGPASRVVFHDLVVREEDDQVVVGRLETCEFVALPEIGGAAVELLRGGLSVGEVEERLAASSGAAVDLSGFVADLADVGFVRSVDGQAMVDAEPFRSSLPWLQARHCRWLFAPAATVAYGLLVLGAVATLVVRPGLVPATGDFFWSSHPSLVLAVNTAMVLMMIAVHELAHLVAARSLGVPGRFALGTRLNVLVAETNVTGLWAVDPRRRYRVYLAGMTLDGLVLCSVILLQAALPRPHALLGALALLQVLGIVSQLQLYLRTDLYFVLAGLLRAKNLMEDSAAYMLSLVHRAVARLARRDAPEDVLASLPPRERRAVRVYGTFIVIGSAVALGTYAVAGLPILVGLYTRAVHGILGPSPLGVVDGLVTLLVEGSLQLVFLWVLVRNRGARARAVLRRVLARRPAALV